MSAERRVAVVGARPGDPDVTRAILEDVARFVDALPAGVVVVSGGAAGVDSAAVSHAHLRGLATAVWLPDYERHGRRAPLERNGQIVADSTELHAWPAPWSRGTHDAVRRGRQAGIPVTVHEPWRGEEPR